jgi:hypothetical protein
MRHATSNGRLAPPGGWRRAVREDFCRLAQC